MKVDTIRSTNRPEELVATAARNDYSSTGVIDPSFSEIMKSITIDLDKVREDESIVEARKRKLVRSLMDDGHWGVFEHPSLTLSLEDVTRVSMAQITRHRQFTFDIMSLRYVALDEIDSITDRFSIPDAIQGENAVSRRGVSELDDGVEEEFIDSYTESMNRYQQLLDMGVPAEEARKVLPMGTKVNIVMSGNARAWLHLLNIRGKADVQGEARDLAELIMEECKEWMPCTFSYYDENHLPLKLNP